MCGAAAWGLVRVWALGELEPQPTTTRAEIAVAICSLIA
jgi:hypothetical protein